MTSLNFFKKRNLFVHIVFVKTIIETMIVSTKKNQKKNDEKNQKNIYEWRQWFKRKHYSERLKLEKLSTCNFCFQFRIEIKIEIEKRLIKSSIFDDDSETSLTKTEKQNQIIITTASLIAFENLSKIFLNDFNFSFNCESKNVLQIAFNVVFHKKHILKNKNHKKYNLKSISSNESKNFKFKNYTNFFCKTHLQSEIELKTCYDTNSKSFLISMKTIRNHYSIIKMHKMKNDQQIRCRRIDGQKKSNMWIEFSIRNRMIDKNFVIIKKKFYIISNLSCFLIMKIDFIKIYDIVSKWNKKNKFCCDSKKTSNSNHRN